MADADSRIETLEDEIKVLKGEVRRTLVDLRALLMREDSPLNDSGGGRRAALSERDPEDQVLVARSEVNKTITQEPSQAVGPPLVSPPPAPPPNANNQEQERAMAEQQRRLQEQEQRIAEQDRRMDELSRRSSEENRGGNEGTGLDPEQQRRLDEQEKRIAGQDRQMAEMSRMVQDAASAARDNSGLDPEQQRRQDAQERRISEQDRQMAEMSRMVQDAASAARDNSRLDPEQQRRQDEQDKRITEQDRQMAEMNRRMAAEVPPAQDASDPNLKQAQKILDQDSRLEAQGKQMANLVPMVEALAGAAGDGSGPDEEPQGGFDPQEENLQENPMDLGQREDQGVGAAQVMPRTAGTRLSPIDRRFQEDLGDSQTEPEAEAWDEYAGTGGEDGFPAGAEGPDHLGGTNQFDRVQGHQVGRARRGVSAERRLSAPIIARAADTGPGAKPRARDQEHMRSNNPSAGGSNGAVQQRRGDHQEPDCPEPNREDRGSRVYDAYWDLFNEAEEPDPPDGYGGSQAPLDVNLLASLVRWTALAKGRVGDERLKGILDLYLGSGHDSPRLRELLGIVSNMVESNQAETNQAAQECIDLLSHLHGILTGGLQIGQIPENRMSD